MPFLKTEIDFSITKSLPTLVSDYLAGKDSLKPFLSDFPGHDGFQKSLERRKIISAPRSTLVEVLKDQYSGLGSKADQAIDLLLDENTFTVTTGHQLNLFTGPLYFV